MEVDFAGMTQRIIDEELAEFVQRREGAADAYMRGDIDRYLEVRRVARPDR